MAAGDVTIDGNSGRSLGRNLILICGTVTLDGANPTPVNLDGLCDSVLMATVSFERTTAPGADPVLVTCSPSGATLNVYAWKATTAGAGGNADLVASTNNAVEVAFVALCRR